MNSTATRFTLKEVVDFCVAHKKEKGFQEHNEDQIAHVIIEANKTNVLYIVADDIGLCGVCVARIDGPTLYVHEIICTRNGFKTLIEEATKRFPGLEIRGERNEKLKIYWKA